MTSSTIHDTFVIERSFPHSRERLYAALSDPATKERWYAADRTGVLLFEMDFRLGGAERQHYTLGSDTPYPGLVIEHEGQFEDIVPGRRIVLATSMSFGGNRVSTALITYEVADDGSGSMLTFTHQAAFYEGADGPEMRRDGWEKLFDVLARLLAS